QPRALLLGALLLSVFGLLLFGALHTNERIEKARISLIEGKGHLERRQFVEAERVLQRGLATVEGLPFSDQIFRDLTTQLDFVRQRQMVHELGRIVDEVRFRHAGDLTSDSDLGKLEKSCRSFWEGRNRVLTFLRPGLDPRLQQQLHADFLDLAILWT